MSTRFNVLEHVMVPDHQNMSEEEIAELLKRFAITLDQLPRIYSDDPSTKAIGATIGDVIRITRKSQTAGVAESYRYVVKRPKK
ncbi:DNA-directed RNA polymerase subunit H [Methanofollis fontis]|uniref:DNA-directed RNA polymerase subunit Rpo5 n=1 Tax=Methanofollis fontis TaxID=2052832 RepID=A0A483CPE8_9EURY|nr:DNA-directed RNA polymerase subunit H [Methanofollis fontis]TAJ44912.1 DNA-directed RNA polymerase subunit H [Methanofollis fontis]